MNFLPIYSFYLFKSFTPFSPFLVPYLIDIKKFKNKEIYNTLNVYFFISSLFVSLVVFLIVKLFDNRVSLFLDTLIELIACVLLYLMKDRNFLVGKIVSILHGSSTALNSVLKSIIVSNSGNDVIEKNKLMNNITIIKCISSVVSAWIGQDIFLRVRNYDLNLFISGSNFILSLVITFFIRQNASQETTKVSLINEIRNNSNLLHDLEIVSHCLLSITANILVICLSFFSANVFIERKRTGNLQLSNLIFVLMTPLRYISYFLVKIYTIMVDNNKDVSTESYKDIKDIVIHGYVDGLSKICSALICYFVGSLRLSDKLRYPFSFCVAILSIVSLFLLYMVSSLSFSYLFFIFAFSLSTSLKIILYSVYSSHKNKNFIFSFNMFVSSLIHISLSYFSILRKANVQQRFKYYVIISIFLSGLSFILYLLKNR